MNRKLRMYAHIRTQAAPLPSSLTLASFGKINLEKSIALYIHENRTSMQSQHSGLYDYKAVTRRELVYKIKES